MTLRLIPCLVLPLLAACVTPPPPTTGDRPMDEVPLQERMANGDRHYSFANGCVIVIEPVRAVVTSEGAVCQSYHRDIALLYAAGD